MTSTSTRPTSGATAPGFTTTRFAGSSVEIHSAPKDAVGNESISAMPSRNFASPDRTTNPSPFLNTATRFGAVFTWGNASVAALAFHIKTQAKTIHRSFIIPLNTFSNRKFCGNAPLRTVQRQNFMSPACHIAGVEV